MKAEILPCKTYTKVGDQMTWPTYDQRSLVWALKHGTEEQVIEKRMLMASIVGAYMALIERSPERRNEACKALKNAKLAKEKEQ